MKKIIAVYILFSFTIFAFAGTTIEKITRRLDASETFYKSFGDIKDAENCNLMIRHFIADFEYFMKGFQNLLEDEMSRALNGDVQVDQDVQTQSYRFDHLTDIVIDKITLFRGDKELEKSLDELNKLGKSFNSKIEVTSKLSQTGNLEQDLFTAMDKLAALSVEMDKIVTADDCVKVIEKLNSRFAEVANLILKVANKYGNMNDVPKSFNDEFELKSKKMNEMMGKFPDAVARFKDSDVVIKSVQAFQKTANTWDSRLRKFY